MIGLQNIIGGEKNFLASGRGVFCWFDDGFLERKRVFMAWWPETIKTAPQQETIETKQERLKELKKQKEFKDFQSNLVNEYVKWRYSNKNNDANNFEEYILKNKDKIKDWNKYLSDTKDRMSIWVIQDVIEVWEKKFETLNKSKEWREAALWAQALETVKDIDFSRIFESEWWIIAAWLSMLAIFKMNKKLWYWLLWTIWALFLWNKVTQWWLNDIFWKAVWKQLDNLHLTDIEDVRKKEFVLWSKKEVLWFSEIMKMKKEDFLEDAKKYEKLKDVYLWKNKNPDFKNKPDFLTDKEYAWILLKFLAKKWWGTLVKWQWINELNDKAISNWFNQIKKWNLNYVWQFVNEEVESTLSGDFKWLLENGKDITYETFKLAKNSWILDFFKETKDDFKEIFGNTAFLQYKDWKWHILDKVWWEWNENIVVESWDATKRMAILSYKWITETFSWMVWWENPVDELKTWLKSPQQNQ